MVALLVTDNRGQTNGCSGTIVANAWVLTAAHCVTNPDGTAVATSAIQAAVGKTSNGTGALSAVAEVVRSPGYVKQVSSDVALLRLSTFDANRWHAVPLAFEPNVVSRNGGVTFYSYGNRTYGVLPQPLQPLQKSPDGSYVRDIACDASPTIGAGFVCYRPSSSRLMSAGANSLTFGDSGSAALVWQAGAWQIQAVADVVERPASASTPGSRVGATSMLSTGPIPYTNVRGWIRAVTRMPTVAAGTIVRDRLTGNSWHVGATGYRTWIPAGVYPCLVGQGHIPLDLNQIDIDTIPDQVGTHATCQNSQPSTVGRTAFVRSDVTQFRASDTSPWQTLMNGAALSVAVDKTRMGIVNSEGAFYRVNDSSPWIKITGGATAIAVADNGRTAFVRSDVTQFRASDTSPWQTLMNGAALSVAVDKTRMGIVNSEGAFYRVNDSSPWIKITGGATAIAVADNGRTAFVRSDGTFYRATDNSPWMKLMDGPAMAIAVDEQRIGIVNSEGAFYRVNDSSPWIKITGGATTIAVAG